MTSETKIGSQTSVGSATQRGPVSGAAGNHLAHSRACLPSKTVAFFHPGAPLNSDNLFLSLPFTSNPTILFLQSTLLHSHSEPCSSCFFLGFENYQLILSLYPGVCQQPPHHSPKKQGLKVQGANNLSGRSPLVHLVHIIGIHLFSKALAIYFLVYFTRQCFLLEQIMLVCWTKLSARTL